MVFLNDPNDVRISATQGLWNATATIMSSGQFRTARISIINSTSADFKVNMRVMCCVNNGSSVTSHKLRIMSAFKVALKPVAKTWAGRGYLGFKVQSMHIGYCLPSLSSSVLFLFALLCFIIFCRPFPGRA